MSTAEFTIRRAEVRDAAAIAEVYNEAILKTTATFDTEQKTAEDRLEWLRGHDDRHPVFVAEVAGGVVGWACLTKWSDRPAYDGTAETSFYVAERHRGGGIGRALKERLIEEARKTGLHTLIARVAEGSEASLHLNRSLGFLRVGTMREVGLKHGKRLDVYILQLMLDPEPVTASACGGKPIHQVDVLTPAQVEQLHGLYQSEWWTRGRPLDDVRIAVENSSLVIGFVESEAGRLVGFCRVLTDFVFRATIFDVIVAEEWRGRGLGRRLIEAVVGHPQLQRVRTLWLCCEPDKMPFYEKWGFETFPEELLWMERAHGNSEQETPQ